MQEGRPIPWNPKALYRGYGVRPLSTHCACCVNYSAKASLTFVLGAGQRRVNYPHYSSSDGCQPLHRTYPAPVRPQPSAVTGRAHRCRPATLSLSNSCSSRIDSVSSCQYFFVSLPVFCFLILSDLAGLTVGVLNAQPCLAHGQTSDCKARHARRVQVRQRQPGWPRHRCRPLRSCS